MIVDKIKKREQDAFQKETHHDHSTGEYHYHHGYSAHSHYDIDGDGIIDCPYDFDNKTNHNTVNNNTEVTNSNKTDANHKKEISFSDIIKITFEIIGMSLLALLCGSVVLIWVYELLVALVCWVSEKIFRKEIPESSNALSIIVIFVIVVSVVIISTMIILKDYGIT